MDEASGPDAGSDPGDDERDSAPGIFVFLLGVLMGNLNAAVLFMGWKALKKLVGW